MNLQNLKVSACYESETNPRGNDFEGKPFDELVASIKEKGVLTPVLARERLKEVSLMESGKMEVGPHYEIVAGNRRLRAAKLVGLSHIPAQVVEMNDQEAREAQIVENLQRQDVHPLEEGEAYRQLIEESKLTVKDIAVKVGKPEAYVKGRLFLTNLTDAVAKAYRKGELPDSWAVVIAKLAPAAQNIILKKMKDNSYMFESIDSLKGFIVREFSNPLSFQPWLKDATIAEACGPCQLCPPNREDLFGKTKVGQCTDLKCWRCKMTGYIAWMREQEPGLVLVSSNYGKPETAGAISRSDYELLETKKDYCEFRQEALVIEGDDLGKVIKICVSKDCEEHHAQHTDYAKSPKEKEQRKKELEKEEAKRLKFDTAICEALLGIEWPLSEKHLDALLDITLENMGTNSLMPILKRYGFKAMKDKDGGRDCRTPLREAVLGSNDEKLRMIFELHLPTYNSYNTDELKELNKRIAKL